MALAFTIAGPVLTLAGAVCAAVAFVQTCRQEPPRAPVSGRTDPHWLS